MPALPDLRLISHKSSICFFERFAWQAVFSRPFFQKNYPHSLAKCLSCRCRQQREKYAVLRQEQSVNCQRNCQRNCQSKILPQYQISLIAHFVLAGILLGSAFPKPCLCGLRRLKIPQNIFSDFFKNSSVLPPVFLLLVRGHHAQPANKKSRLK